MTDGLDSTLPVVHTEDVTNTDLPQDNETFLQAIFGSYYNFSHVCSFMDDPS